MDSSRKRRALGSGRSILMACVILLLAHLGWAGEVAKLPSWNPADLTWSEIDLKAEKFFLTARSHLLISSTDACADVAGADLCPLEADDIPLKIELDSELLGRRSKSGIWFSGRNGTTSRTHRLETGKKNRIKEYRFTPRSICVVRRNPAAGEDDTLPEAWSDVSEEVRAYPRDAELACRVTDPTVLLYAASVAPLAQSGDSVRMVVLSRGCFFNVDLVWVERCVVAAEFIEVRAGTSVSVREERNARRLLLQPRPLQSSHDDDAFSILGLQGKVEVYVDETGGFPLLVTGQIKVIGRVEVRLQRVVLGDL